MLGQRVNCACRVAWVDVVAVCGLPTGSPPTDMFEVVQDWAGRPSLTVEDAAAFVESYRAAQAKAQARQEALNASRAAQDEAKQRAEWLMLATQQWQARREAAMLAGGREAVASLKGLVTPQRQAEAWEDGRDLAAERFDAANPVPAA